MYGSSDGRHAIGSRPPRDSVVTPLFHDAAAEESFLTAGAAAFALGSTKADGAQAELNSRTHRSRIVPVNDPDERDSRYARNNRSPRSQSPRRAFMPVSRSRRESCEAVGHPSETRILPGRRGDRPDLRARTARTFPELVRPFPAARCLLSSTRERNLPWRGSPFL